MRSTGFVIFSILIHVAVVLAIALHPTRIVGDSESIEVTMNQPPAEQPGVVDAPEQAAPSKPQEIAKPQAEAAPLAAPKPVVAKPTPPSPAPVAKIERRKPAPAVAAPVPVTTNETDEDIKKEVESETAAVPAPAEPVKEVATAPPVPAVAPTPAPPVAQNEPPVPAAAPVAAVPAGVVTTPAAAATTTQEQETGELAKGGDTKEAAVAVAELKQAPGNKPPKYPMKARIENRQGTTELVYRVTAEGTVAEVAVDKSSGSKDLDAEAVKAISNYRFVPGQEGWARHPVSFALKGTAATLPGPKLRTKSGAQAKTE